MQRNDHKKRTMCANIPIYMKSWGNRRQWGKVEIAIYFAANIQLLPTLVNINCTVQNWSSYSKIMIVDPGKVKKNLNFAQENDILGLIEV